MINKSYLKEYKVQDIDIIKLLNLMPLHIYWKDRNSVYLGSNLAHAQIFGYSSPSEIIGKTDFQLSSDISLAQSWIQNDKKIMQSGSPMVVEEAAIINNHEVIVLSYKAPFKDELGDIAGIIGISMDITEEKKKQKKIFEEKNKAQIALDNIIARLPAHVYWMDNNNHYLGCNDLHAESAGLKNRHDIIGKTNAEMSWAEKAEFLDAINDKVRITKAEFCEEETGNIADGIERTFLSRKTPLLDEHKNVVGVLGISFDITDRKQMEEELIKSKNAAESASRAKTEFLANMSHDMKTPLTGVVGMADLMAHDNGARELDRQRAETIYACGLQAVSLFDSCLELSKLEMSEWVTKTEIFSLQTLCDDIAALFLPKAQTKGISLTLEYDHALPQVVEGHRESLYRVLLNLVGNALKFTEKGNVTLRAALMPQKDAQHVNVELQVQDTGMGISEDKHQIIFEKLHRLTPAYEGKTEGSGIGLYIVDQYVKRMGGTIKVNSCIGEGSTFIVSIPFIVPANILPQHAAPLEISDIPPQIKIAQPLTEAVSSSENIKEQLLPHILLVEDMELIQFITKSLLSDAGFSVDIASTGKEALEKFSSKKYDFIYMDIGLPDIDGYTVTQEMRNKEVATGAEKTPIVALTGHGVIDVQAFCGEVGMQGVFSKPLTREQAEKVWQRYGKHELVDVPGLTIL